MFLLDLLAKYGPYAFVLFYLWYIVAFLVAAWRVRQSAPGKIIFEMLKALFFPVLYLWLFYPGRIYLTDQLWVRVLFYGALILFPLSMVSNSLPANKTPSWRQAGYAHLSDVLLLQAPVTPAVAGSEEVTSQDRRINRLTYWLVFDIAVALAVVTFLGNGLQPCDWFDLFSGYSGCVRSWSMPDGSVQEVAFSGDGAVIAASNLYGPVNLYQVADGSAMQQLPERGYPCSHGVSFSPDGQQVATLTNMYEVMIRDVYTAKVIHSWKVPGADGLVFSPDGDRLAVSVPESGIQLWRTADWTLEQTLIANGGSPMAFSPDGRLLAGRGVTQTVTIWNVPVGSVRQILPMDGYSGITFSPDDEHLAISSSGDPVTIWDVENGEPSQTIPVEAATNVAYSPDSKFLLVGTRYEGSSWSHRAVTLWRMKDSQQVMFIPEAFSLDCVAFSPVENKFAYGAWEVLKLFQIPDRLQ